jgi:hypothetical protein
VREAETPERRDIYEYTEDWPEQQYITNDAQSDCSKSKRHPSLRNPVTFWRKHAPGLKKGTR